MKIRVASKRAAGALSPPVLVKDSPNADIDYGCLASGTTCRWGDYPAATPDPTVRAGATVGRVWFTNMYDAGCTSPTTASCWQTENGYFTP